MKIKLVGSKNRYIPLLHQDVFMVRGEIKEFPKELGESLLRHNTKDRIMWEEVKNNKKGDD